MPIYRVQAPDGSILRIQGPDNAAESDLLSAAQAHYSSQQQQVPNPATWGGNLNIGPLDTGIRLPVGTDQMLSGIGSGIADAGQGIKERLGLATPQDVAAKRSADAPLKSTFSGAVGNFLGNALPAMAFTPIPGANTVAGAAAIGGGLGYLQPTAPGESVALNTGAGALGGAGGQGLANLTGRLIAPVRNALSPEEQRLASTLTANGVPLDLAQRTGSKPLQITNSVLQNLPFTSGAEEAKRATQQAAYNRALLGMGGQSASAATPDVVSAGLNTAGQTIGDVAKRNSINIDGPLLSDLFKVYDNYEKVLEPNQRALIGENINAILNQRGILSGETYQNTRSTLGRLMASKDPNMVQAAKGIRQALDDAAARSINPQDLGAFNTARQQYAVMKTIGKAVQGGGGVTGDIPPVQLRQAVANSNPTNYVKGLGPLNDMARAGYRFLRDPIQNSGTAQRGYYQGLLTAQGLGGLAAGGGSYYENHDPVRAAEMAAAPFLAPLIVQKALANGLLGKYLAAGPTRGLIAQETSRLLGPSIAGAGATLLTRPQ